MSDTERSEDRSSAAKRGEAVPEPVANALNIMAARFYEDGVLVPSRVFRALEIWQQAADAEAELRAEMSQQLWGAVSDGRALADAAWAAMEHNDFPPSLRGPLEEAWSNYVNRHGGR